MPKDQQPDKEIDKLKELYTWCDQRRSAPEWTTLGMVQDKIKELMNQK